MSGSGGQASVYIEKGHRPWFIVSLVILVAGGAWYGYEVRRGHAAVTGWSGGSAAGLTFGFVASAFILFMMSKRPRKWLARIPFTSEGFWLRGHFWLGALVAPLVWLHGGFHHGGVLTSVLMWLLYAVTISAFIAIAFQNFIPSAATMPLADQENVRRIPAVIERLAAEAREVAAVAGPEDGQELDRWRAETTAAIRAREGRLLIADYRREELAAAAMAAPVVRSEHLKELYVVAVRPYLEGPGGGESVLTNRVKAAQLFRRYRTVCGDELRGAVNDLESLCDECRRLRLQQRMSGWLQSWLLIHIPLSLALLVLGVVHAVGAWRY
jgi:hypothetical protein